MIVGIGVDIAENSRFSSLSEAFKRRIYTGYELDLAEKAPHKEEYLSSRFAAKEAFSKALGTGFGTLQPKDIEVHEEESGKPYITILKELDSLQELNTRLRIHLSLSHERVASIAMVVLEDVSL